jgi:hypothetical protein
MRVADEVDMVPRVPNRPIVLGGKNSAWYPIDRELCGVSARQKFDARDDPSINILKIGRNGVPANRENGHRRVHFGISKWFFFVVIGQGCSLADSESPPPVSGSSPSEELMRVEYLSGGYYAKVRTLLGRWKSSAAKEPAKSDVGPGPLSEVGALNRACGALRPVRHYPMHKPG